MGQDMTSRIRAMSSPEEFSEIAQRIEADRPDQLVLLFAELHAQRARILAGADAENARKNEWSASLLAVYEWRDEGEGFSALRASTPGADAFGPWREAPVAAFEHFWGQAQAADQNRVLRALYLQGLWELRALWQAHEGAQLPKPIDVARAVATAHADAAVWIAARDLEPAIRGMRVAQHWKTAVRIAGQIGQPRLLLGALAGLRNLQRRFITEAPHWALALVECEVGLAAGRGQRYVDLVPDDRLRDLLQAVDEIARGLVSMGSMEHVETQVLEVRLSLERLLGPPPDQREVARRRAQLYEEHARRSPSGIVRSMHWKYAAAEYQQAGLREDGARAKAEARDALRLAEEQGEFHEISVPVTVNPDDMEKVVAPFFDDADTAVAVLGRMSTRLFVPSLEGGRRQRVRPRSIVSQIAITVPVVDDRTLAEIAPDTPEQLRYEERRALVQEVAMMSGLVLSELFSRLRAERHLHSADLLTILSASNFVETDDLPFLKTAAERYMADDRIAAIHVLVPRIEQLVRRILKAAGTEVTAMRDGELRERPLGELLRAGEVDGTMPPELVQLLQAILSEAWGFNLRNKVAHGLLRENECSQANADRLLHTAMVLAGIRLDSPRTGSPSDEDRSCA